MKNWLLIFFSGLCLFGCKSNSSKETPPESTVWVHKMVDYSVNEYMPPSKFKFDWSQATLMKGLVIYRDSDFGDENGDLISYFDRCLKMTADIESGIHPNVVSMGHLLSYMARNTGSVEYEQRAMKIYEDYKDVIRAENGAISHRPDIVELWDDTIYMVGLFLMEMYQLTGEDKYIDEFVLQLKTHHEVLYRSEFGLWVHGWYQDVPSSSWFGDFGPENNPSQTSNEYWGRGNGWLMIALADALEITPEASGNYDIMKDIFLELVSSLPKLQDEKTGHWYQLPARKGEEGNWIDSSCTSMFGYAIQKGLRLGILDKAVYAPVADKAYEGLVRYSIKELDNGYATSTNVCEGTVIGNKEYYYGRDRQDGKECALGTFIMFGVERNKLKL